MSHIYDYLIQLLGDPKATHLTQKGLQYNWNCPFCGDHKYRFFANTDRKVVWCHNCEYTGSIITFISDINHIDWRDALQVFRGYEGYSTKLPDSLEEEIYTRFITLGEPPQEKYVFPLPEEYISMMGAKGLTGHKAYLYLKGRGLNADDMCKYDIGYCDKGKYANRIIMPDYENGKLIYWQARSFLPTPTSYAAKKSYRKVLNPSLTEEQVKRGEIAVEKSEVISNIDLIKEHGIAVICEGKFDAFSLGEMGACIHGKHMSDAQFLKLAVNKHRIDRIIIMLDSDAMKNSIVCASRLDKHFPDRVSMCHLPEGQDPSSLGKEKCLEAVINSYLYTPLTHIRSRIFLS